MQHKGTHFPQLLMIYSNVYQDKRLYPDKQRKASPKLNCITKGQRYNNTAIKNRFFPCNWTAE